MPAEQADESISASPERDLVWAQLEQAGDSRVAAQCGRPRGRPWRGIGPPSQGLVLLLVLVLLAAPAHADRARGLALAREGRCQAALLELRDRVADAPDDAEAWLVIGTCESRLGRYAPSVEALLRARSLAPELPEVDLRLGIAHFHLGQIEEATQDLERAGRKRVSSELLLYRGLIQLEGAEDDHGWSEAARALEAARRAGPDQVEPVASYYAGVAWSRAHEEERAREALERVVEGWPDSRFAPQALAALDKMERRRFFARVEGAFEYDDNVVLRGAGVALPSEISDERDVRAAWTVDVGGSLFEGEDYRLGGRFVYSGRAHRDLTGFDSHYPSLSLWIDRELSPESLLRFQYVFGYAWVDGDPFASTHRALAYWIRDFERLGTTTASAEFFTENYRFSNEDVPDGPGQVGAPCLSPSDVLCAPPGIDESHERNRDGHGVRLRLEQVVRPGPVGLEFRGGLEGMRFSARGSEYTFTGGAAFLGAYVPLPLAFGLRVDTRLGYRPYRYATTFPATTGLVAGRQYGLPERRRRETTFIGELALERPIGRNVLVGVRWRYVRNKSSEDVFDYRQNVVGAYVSFALGGG